MGKLGWRKRGRQFEDAEKQEWHDVESGGVSFERTLELRTGRRGRIDVLIDELDGSQSIIEVKATDWDVMADCRVRPNILRHARQVMKYIHPFWDTGIDVCAGITYPRAPRSDERRQQIEDTLAEQSIQVSWHDERNDSP